MAIVFILPKKNKRIVLWIIIVLLSLFLLLISLIIFPLQLENKSFIDQSSKISDVPDIKINLDILDSDNVKNLEPFSGGVISQFVFSAQDKNGRKITDTILAASEEEARKILEQRGLTISSLEEIAIGKGQPFVPYYQIEENENP